MQYDRVQELDRSNVGQLKVPFQGKGNLGPIWANVTQPYITLTGLEILRNILA